MLPNGYLVLEGTKEVVVNSEHQMVTVRGVVRPADLATGNTIQSNQIAQMEIKIDGKGVVNDAIRRPYILCRLLMGFFLSKGTLMKRILAVSVLLALALSGAMRPRPPA